jgi:hypothetical protein
MEIDTADNQSAILSSTSTSIKGRAMVDVCCATSSKDNEVRNNHK